MTSHAYIPDDPSKVDEPSYLVEPRPPEETAYFKVHHYGNRTIAEPFDKHGRTLAPPSILSKHQKDDEIYLQEEWVNLEDDPYVAAEVYTEFGMESERERNSFEHPSTMPEHLARKRWKVIDEGKVELVLPSNWDNNFSHCDSDKQWRWMPTVEVM
jgi:hypothetical protein